MAKLLLTAAGDTVGVSSLFQAIHKVILLLARKKVRNVKLPKIVAQMAKNHLTAARMVTVGEYFKFQSKIHNR